MLGTLPTDITNRRLGDPDPAVTGTSAREGVRSIRMPQTVSHDRDPPVAAEAWEGR